jgi:hypothetical protein
MKFKGEAIRGFAFFLEQILPPATQFSRSNRKKAIVYLLSRTGKTLLRPE